MNLTLKLKLLSLVTVKKKGISMAYSKEQQEQFLELRARGLSFDKISSELGISKPVLLKWSGELENEISKAEYFETQALLEKHKLNKRHKIESLARQLEKVNEQINNSDLSQVNIKDLFTIRKNLEQSLKIETENLKCNTGICKDTLDFFKEKQIFLY
jgi:hypothetical protein